MCVHRHASAALLVPPLLFNVEHCRQEEGWGKQAQPDSESGLDEVAAGRNESPSRSAFDNVLTIMDNRGWKALSETQIDAQRLQRSRASPMAACWRVYSFSRLASGKSSGR